jgi:DNA-binding transcriptional MerR regulator
VAKYSIRELEQLSGIKAHTIRIWEQRYGILNPQRTETNIRFYDDADLKILLNVSLLNDKGYKISKIARMSQEELSDEVLAVTTGSDDKQVQINALVIAMLEMCEEKFERMLGTTFLQLGFENAMLQVVYPFLNKIGILWQTNNICPAHEHFVCNLIRQKLIVAIDGQVLPDREKSRRFLLFLPEGELHELGLLFMHYLLRVRNHHVMYLGQNLPLKDLEAANNYYKADFLVTVLTSFPERDHVQGYINALADTFPYAQILAYGYQLEQENLHIPANIKKLERITNFIEVVGQI